MLLKSYGYFCLPFFAIVFAVSSTALMISNCLGVVDNMDQNKSVEVGIWGGAGVSVTVEKADVKFEFDCAEAEIRKPLTTDNEGDFRVEGFYKRHPFGPIRLNNPPKFVAAIFEGKVRGKIMTYKITLSEENQEIGEFVAEHGQHGRIRRCL